MPQSHFDLSNYPNHLHPPQAQLDNLQTTLQNNATNANLELIAKHLQKGEYLKQFHKILIGSRFAAEQLCKHPQWFAELISQNHLNTQWNQEDYRNWFKQSQDTPLEQWNKHLRQQRNKAMARIIWRDFNRLANTQQTTAELTAMAEEAIQSTLDYHYHQLSQTLGTPLNEQGQQQSMLIIGMGKLGAWELNLSSDVDLIFAYPESGNTQLNDNQKKSGKTISNQEFFTKLGQKIIQSLDQTTADGFVFRVDMRLRPYGQSGALVSNFNALEDYYQTQGREWERFAMIKARVVAKSMLPQNPANIWNRSVPVCLKTVTDRTSVQSVHGRIDSESENTLPHTSSYDAKNTLMALLRGFTYRRYVDFSAIDALRNLKQLITREVKRRKLHNNVKLGAGGIREVEFIAQAFQIIRGGRDTQLQDRRVLTILPLLPTLNCLPEGVDQQLINAYLFLRNTEHAIQGYDDKQTQELPADNNPLARIAFIMGYQNTEDFNQQLTLHRNIINQQFSDVIAPAEASESNNQDTQSSDWKSLWQSLTEPMADEADKKRDHIQQLNELGFQQAEQALQILRALLQTPSIFAMASISRQRLDQLMPQLLHQVSSVGASAVDTSATGDATTTLARLSELLISIARRSAYLLLLIENPQALQQLITLSQASPWISAQLAQHPALLDELLNPESLYTPPSKQVLTQDLQQHMLRIEDNDLEGQMEGLRYFRSAHSLQVAACEVTGRMHLMKVSDYLSELAEVICEYSLQLAWTEMTERYGYPDGDARETPNFIIVGYGKLGGIELGHNSDLDLVFIHNASSNGETNGERVIDNHTFYARLGQKIIHLLNTRTPAGQLYEIDMRLRPSGNSGLLTSSLQAYDKYQNSKAWTWEHQALVRARPVAGCPELMQSFEEVRQKILKRKRPIDTLRKDVIEMRLKMRDQLGSNKKQQAQGLFHLKQDAGGIVDIEFMVQYAVLAWASDTVNPVITRYTDNIRILESLKESEQLNAGDAEQLIGIYKTYRSKGHRLALQQQPSLIPADEFASERQIVMEIWRKLLN